MHELAARWIAWEPYGRSLLRVMAAFCFIQFGTAKVFAFPGSMLPDESITIASVTPSVSSAGGSSARSSTAEPASGSSGEGGAT